MKVLVVAPHPDDESIGCGGTICLHRDRGDRVVIVYLTSGELGLKELPVDEARRIRESEAELAAQVLGVSELTFLRYADWYLSESVNDIAAALAPILAREAPELVYLPHENEGHPDHQAAIPIVRAALKCVDIVRPTLLSYEVWTPLPDYYHVENISGVIRRKLAAVRCHKSQLALLPYQRAVVGLNLYRGVVAGGCRYAEIFQNAALDPEPLVATSIEVGTP
jgi:LmbE family N-acetylglucosaminyl deacetylase